MKIAIATPPYPHSLEEGLHWAETLTVEAALQKADIVCFPESYLPGYPLAEEARETVTDEQLQSALSKVQAFAKKHGIAIIMPMDWYMDGNIYNVAQVISNTGALMGMQVKNQLDPSEETIWKPGSERHLFEIEGVKFGIVICHEGFRYPETVRWAARQGAKIVFHPNLTGSNVQGFCPKDWGQKESPYYEKAHMMRALENTIYFAPSNYQFKYPESASSVIGPNGTCLVHQEYGKTGVIVAELDLSLATGLLAKRFKPALIHL